MLDNIPITNPARDRAWEAFIRRKDVRKLFNNDEGFNFPLSREYYDMWCLCWAKAWDAGFYEGYKSGEEAVQKPPVAMLNGREVVMGTVRIPGSTKDRPGWVYKDTGAPVGDDDPRMPKFGRKK